MGYMNSDMPANHQNGVAQLRRQARQAAPGGMVGNPLPILERPDGLDVARLVSLKRGHAVLLPVHEAVEDTLDLSGPIRQIAREVGPGDAIAWMHQNAPTLREQYRPLIGGQSVAVGDDIDPDLAAAFVAMINEV